jgi:hypothetical protein
MTGKNSSGNHPKPNFNMTKHLLL